jgi:hypothetical protein
MGLSIRAYAKHRGVSHSAVIKAIKAGRIKKEADGTINPSVADASWQENTFPDTSVDVEPKFNKTKSEPLVTSGPSYAQSRAVKEAYNARLAKLSYEEKSGSLVRTDIVKVAWFNALRVLRDRVLNMPDRLAPILSAETDIKIIRDLLDEDLRQILDDTANTILKLNSPED